MTLDQPLLRSPTPRDVPAISDLIASCPPLERNSLYCTALQCTHFVETCRIADIDGRPVGWLSGYRLPQSDDTLFVWQVAVSPDVRGRGVGKMLLHSVCRHNPDIRHLQSTITPDNEASWALFESFAEESNASLTRKPYFGRQTHFGGRHATEHIVTIGPLENGTPNNHS